MQRHATSDNMRIRLRVRGHLYWNCFFKVLCISKSSRIRPAVSFLLQVEFPVIELSGTWALYTFHFVLYSPMIPFFDLMFLALSKDGILLLSFKLNPREEIFEFYHRCSLSSGSCRLSFRAEGKV